MATLGYTAMRKPIANEGLVFMEEQRQQLGLLPAAVTRTKFANKGLDFTEERRQHLGLRGLLLAAVTSTESRTGRALAALHHKTSPI
ncbi:hypothetical protein PR002_g27513 [Phytophthora rubi]|uniref:Uncharacterized protein n=2 Tax=Phytophthora rubi TaxID=129364 RepID=A0A6A3HLH4_9STRA|nr:hypothetical protein PR002_g27513 [Phytophthora rubi]